MSEVSDEGLAQMQRYLLAGERPVIVTRRHWAVVFEPVASAVVGLALTSFVVARLGDSARAVTNACALVALLLVARALWHLWEWWHDWFVVTDERLLLRYGFFNRRVAVMPLAKVTDMSYNVSLVGQVLRYGEFVFESAGQDQALRNIRYLARSETLFAALSNELFGEHGLMSSRRRRSRASRDDD
ncbi:PH domain-containing protein [Angustibacter aerolatus]